MSFDLLIKFSSDEVRNLYPETLTSGTECGFDLYFPEKHIIPPHARGYKISFKVSCESRPESGYLLVPRSSIGKTPLIMANSIGVIDPTYRGELIACLHNLSDQPWVIEKGTRLFQIIMPSCKSNLKLVEVDQLSQSKRGTGGFGSTGK